MQRKIVKYSNAALCVFISVILLFVPFNVNILKGALIEKNEARASTPVNDALGFIELCAAAAGITTTQFVATIIGCTAVNSGVSISDANAVTMSNTASDNLGAIIDTDDFPAYSTLSQSEQQQWGTEDNYNAAKFNSLLGSYGLSNDVDSYYQSGGVDYQLSQNAIDLLDRIDTVGNNWVTGVGNSISSILGLNFNKSEFNQWLPPEKFTYTADANDAEWPSYLSTTLNYTQATEFGVQFSNNGNPGYRIWITSSPVYCFAGYTPNSSSAQFGVFYFSLNNFNSGNSNNQNPPSSTPNAANSATIDGTTVYMRQSTYNYPLTNSTIPINSDVSYLAAQTFENRAKIYLKMINGSIYDAIPQITGYPSEDIANETYDQNTIIYFPISGISESTQWNDLTQSNGGNSDNPDNPGNTVDLSGIIDILNHIDSDLHNMNIPGEPDLTPLITKLQIIDNHIQSLDFLTSNDLQNINSYIQHIDSDLHNFNFYNNGELKVFDNGVFEELSDIYELLIEISGKLTNWGEIEDAPDIIGDFDFDDIADRVPNLLEVIENVAPFGAMLILMELYTVISSINPIDDPQFVVPFQFGGLDDNQEVTIDLSWMDDIKPVINFFCILMLLLAMTRVTMRIVELEAAS